MPILAILAGTLVGVTLGALGGGGSILTVPILVYLLGQDAHTAVLGSLVVVGATATAGLLAHAKAGRVRWRMGLLFGLLGVGGSIAGSRLSTVVSPEVLLVGFAALMGVAAVLMLLRRRSSAPSPTTPDPRQLREHERHERERPEHERHEHERHERERPEHERPEHEEREGELADGTGISAPRVILAALCVGLLTGFFGVGGGFLVVPALVVVLRLTMPQAIATSLLVITINALAATAARWQDLATIDWMPLAGFAIPAIAGALFGGRLVSRLQPNRLANAFVALIVLVAVYTGLRSLPALL